MKVQKQKYKVKNELTATITANLFILVPENHYNLRNYSEFRILFARTVYYGTESVSYQGIKIWDIVPIVLKCFKSLIRALNIQTKMDTK